MPFKILDNLHIISYEGKGLSNCLYSYDVFCGSFDEPEGKRFGVNGKFGVIV